MRLTQIELTDFRGISHRTIAFGAGVTVVEGPNEVGKSSVLEAMRLVREYKSSSRHRSIRNVQPVGRDAGPEVAIDMQTGPYTLTMRKRWLVQPITELTVTAPKGESLSGDDAHDRFVQILRETVDMGLLHALEVQQGDSLDQPELAQLPALQTALETSADDFDGYDELLARVESEYTQYFTATGRPVRAVRDARQQLADLAQQYRDLRDRSREMDEAADAHAVCRRLAADTAERVEQARTDVADLTRSSAELHVLQEGLASAEREHESAQQRLGALRDQLQARRELNDELEDLRQQAETQRVEAERLELSQTDAQTHARQTAERVASATTALTDAREQARRCEHELSRRRDHDELTRLGAQLERATASEAQLRAAEAVLRVQHIDDKKLRRLTKLQTEVHVATRMRDAAAAQITATRLGGDAVLLDGISLDAGAAREVAVHDHVRIEVEGVVRVDVAPAAKTSELDADVQHAQSALERALSRDGVATFEDAEHSAELRRTADAERQRAETELRAMLEVDDDVPEAIAELRARVETLRARLHSDDEPREPDEAAELDRTAEPDEAAEPPRRDSADLAVLESRSSDARDRLEDTEHEVALAQQANERARERLTEAATAAVRAAEAYKAALAECERLTARIDNDRQSLGDVALKELVDQAERSLQSAAEGVEQAKRRLQNADAEKIELQAENARRLVQSTTAELEDVRTQRDELQGRLKLLAGEGIYDRLQVVCTDLVTAHEHVARTNRAAQAVSTLRETLLRHRDEAQQRYVAPFRRQIERLGRSVFGRDFAVEVSPTLQIASRTLNGRTIPFDSLSAGAREQLALIGRLACAQLVSSDDGAPVVLDDTLGFADPERLEMLNAVLSQLGGSAQVIVLTCQPRRFARIGGAKQVHLTRAEHWAGR
ncbi:AAA family ATPase [Pseudoclavibacter sp. CFCC 11306]|uniref:AAA family ATPase n=1 Tax=Pseudoclavibacter sp. CFCC 11306 TaxID=1564493 RepID=UPI0013017919|nr:AAA family ATPase [Pseudoclavibacter sp. CFCC 11306]KAB1658525.1 AAA family ATPase [Pseudoclavibacter sp. CFCC 11306]